MLCNALTVISNIVLAIAAIIGAIVAVCGLSTWRHELHGQADFGLARRVMQYVYEIRNRFRQIRNDLSAEALDIQYERLNKVLCELDTALLEAEVLWGDTLKPAKQSLKECVSTYRLALRKKNRRQSAPAQVTEEEYNSTEAILFGDYDESDNFATTIEQAVTGFADALRPYLSRRRRACRP